MSSELREACDEPSINLEFRAYNLFNGYSEVDIFTAVY